MSAAKSGLECKATAHEKMAYRRAPDEVVFSRLGLLIRDGRSGHYRSALERFRSSQPLSQKLASADVVESSAILVSISGA